jgi:hypothetical protein
MYDSIAGKSHIVGFGCALNHSSPAWLQASVGGSCVHMPPELLVHYFRLVKGDQTAVKAIKELSGPQVSDTLPPDGHRAAAAPHL